MSTARKIVDRLIEGVDDIDPKEMALGLRYQLYRLDPDPGDKELYNVSTPDASHHIGRIALEDHSKRPPYVNERDWATPKWQQYQQCPWAAYPRFRDTVVYFKTREAAAEYILKTAGVNESADDPDDVIGRNAKSLRLQTTDFKAVHHGTVQWPEFDEASPESDPPYIRYYGYLNFPGVKDLNWNVDLEWDAEIGIRAVGYYGFYDRDDEWRELHDLPTNEAQAKAKALLDKDVTRFLSKLGKFVLISKTFVP